MHLILHLSNYITFLVHINAVKKNKKPKQNSSLTPLMHSLMNDDQYVATYLKHAPFKLWRHLVVTLTSCSMCNRHFMNTWDSLDECFYCGFDKNTRYARQKHKCSLICILISETHKCGSSTHDLNTWVDIYITMRHGILIQFQFYIQSILVHITCGIHHSLNPILQHSDIILICINNV